MTRRIQSGFTLIELVVVITILGILAAFAVPRFVSLESEARRAATESLGGSIRSAAALSHALWLAQGGGATVTVEGQTINITNGYPTAADIDDTLQDFTGFTLSAAGVFQKTGAATPASCQVSYVPPAAANGSPTITVTASSANC